MARMCKDCGREIVLEVERCPFCNYSLSSEDGEAGVRTRGRSELGGGQLVLFIVGSLGLLAGLIWTAVWVLTARL